jgi:hypothetical protein
MRTFFVLLIVSAFSMGCDGTADRGTADRAQSSSSRKAVSVGSSAKSGPTGNSSPMSAAVESKILNQTRHSLEFPGHPGASGGMSTGKILTRQIQKQPYTCLMESTLVLVARVLPN